MSLRSVVATHQTRGSRKTQQIWTLLETPHTGPGFPIAIGPDCVIVHKMGLNANWVPQGIKI
jgi:hypothetical protein